MVVGLIVFTNNSNKDALACCNLFLVLHDTDTSDEKENTSRDQSTTACTAEQDYHRSDEQVNIFLDCSDDQMKSVIRKYIRCVSE